MFKGLKFKFLIIFSIIVLIVLAVFYGIFYMADTNMLTERGKTKVEAAEKYYQALEEQDTRMIQATLNVFTEENDFKDAFLLGNREELFNHSDQLFQQLKKEFGITHFYYHSPDGVNFLRVHNKDIFGDRIDRITFLEAKEKQSVSDGIELGKTAFALRVVSPYFKGDDLIGYVEMGQEINHFIEFIKERESEELVVFVAKNDLNKADWQSVQKVAGLESNWNDYLSFVKIDSTIKEGKYSANFKEQCFSEEKIGQVIKSKERMFFKGIWEDGKFLGCGAFPIRDASDEVVGAVFSVSDLTETKSDTKVVAINMVGSFIVLVLILFSLYSFFINKFFIKPVNVLKEMAIKVAKKDFSARALTDSKDEVGDLTRNFNKMARDLSISNLEVENKIKDRTARLEELNRHMVGREAKMIDLKEEIAKLKNKNEDNA